ncbi:MAG: hypothetical protein WCL33_07625, partial [Planctomycetota bacterium]
MSRSVLLSTIHLVQVVSRTLDIYQRTSPVYQPRVRSQHRAAFSACVASAFVQVALAAASSTPQNSIPPFPPGGFAPVTSGSQGNASAPSTVVPASAPAKTSATTPAFAPTTTPATTPALAPPATADLSPPPILEVSTHGTITLSAQNVAVDALLELLSVRSKQNIVAS